MNNIDNEIAQLEKRLAELKAVKEAESDFLNMENGFEIIIYNEDHDRDDYYKKFKTFNELKEFWESSICKLKPTDKIILEYYAKQEYKSYEASVLPSGKIDEAEFKNLLNVLATLDAFQIISLDFAICNKKDTLRYNAYIRGGFLTEYGNFLDTGLSVIKASMTQEEYWAKVDTGKEFRLFNRKKN